MDKVTIGRNIKFLRKEQNITPKMVENDLGYNKDTLAQIEKGLKGSKEIYTKFSEYFHVELKDLMYTDMSAIRKMEDNEGIEKAEEIRVEEKKNTSFKLRVGEHKPYFMAACNAIIMIFGLINLFYKMITIDQVIIIVGIAPVVSYVLSIIDEADDANKMEAVPLEGENHTITYELEKETRNDKYAVITFVLHETFALASVILFWILGRENVFAYIISPFYLALNIIYVIWMLANRKKYAGKTKDEKSYNFEYNAYPEKIMMALDLLYGYGLVYLLYESVTYVTPVLACVFALVLCVSSTYSVYYHQSYLFDYSVYDNNENRTKIR